MLNLNGETSRVVNVYTVSFTLQLFHFPHPCERGPRVGPALSIQSIYLATLVPYSCVYL